MNFESVRRLANAVLYEGYLLYPYRESAVQNQQRWTFGCLFPPAYAKTSAHPEPASLQAECLLHAAARTRIDVLARFLHLRMRTVSEPSRVVESLQIGDRLIQSGQEAVERQVALTELDLEELVRRARRYDFSFPACRKVECLLDADGMSLGGLVREQRAVEGVLEVSAEALAGALFRLRVRLENSTPLADVEAFSRAEALPFALLSCHLLFEATDGEFHSLLDPPQRYSVEAAACRNMGAWPVLVGALGQRDRMLAAAIILCDYPQIAAESGGDLFDGTEIDEMLTLRIRTLAADEKCAMAAVDPQARELLLRSEGMARDKLLALHGAWRQDSTEPPAQSARRIRIGEVELGPGNRVRLRPGGRADLMDLALAGKIAQIVSIEKDFEDAIFVSVALDDDPGKDLGVAGLPGHRFFFRPDELELPSGG